ncbi:MAG: sulfatase [Verrucomicrobiota bacterium]
MNAFAKPLLKPCLGVLVFYVFVVCAAPQGVNASRASSPPNIIFILVDDQRFDVLGKSGSFPFLKTPHLDRLVDEGVHFENAFVTTSLCGPSRASFLTGAWAHQHGVIVNETNDYDFERFKNFGEVLQEAGYTTAYFGKWHQARHGRPRPGFDHWFSFFSQGKYFDCWINLNGKQFKATRYLTDVLNDRAVEYIQRDHEKRFLLYLSHKAMHEPFTPAPRHEKLYEGVSMKTRDSLENDIAAKPKWMQEAVAKMRNGAALAPVNRHDGMMNMMRTVSAVDDGVGRIREALEKKGILDNTVIIYAGDNGYLYGEQGGSTDKRKAYEPSIRIPLIMRYPKLATPGSKIDAMVLNVDVAPTIIELGRGVIPKTVQGESWLPLLKGGAGRESFLYEYYNEADYRPKGGYGNNPTILCVRTPKWKYTTFPDLVDEIDELYHLEKDPDEFYNLAGDSDHAEKLAEMKALLAKNLEELNYVAPTKLDRSKIPAAPAKVNGNL